MVICGTFMFEFSVSKGMKIKVMIKEELVCQVWIVATTNKNNAGIEKL